MWKFLFLILIVSSVTTQEFKGKIVFVTGGSSGIGYATALEFARSGAHVAFCSRDKRPDWYTGHDAEIRINKDPLVQQAGGSAYFLKVDVVDRAQVRQAIQKIVARYGKLDILINNAAIGGFLGPLHMIPADQIFKGEHDPIQNNVYGTLNCMYEVISYWVKQHQERYKNEDPPEDLISGIIVNLSSYNGIRAAARGSMYSASKHAIVGLTKSVALEYANPPTKLIPRFRINALAPGLIDTPFTRNQIKFIVNGTQPWEGRLIREDDPEWLELKKSVYEPGLVGQRLGTPTQMANIILYLCSEKSRYITGTVVSGDFGLHAR